MRQMKKKNNVIRLLITVLALLLVLAACSNEEPTAVPEPTPEPVVEEPTAVPEPAETTEEVAEMPEISQPIYNWGEAADRLWVLVGYGDALNQTVVEEGVVITAVFSSVDGTVSGSGGCNNYFTNYETTDDGSITINGPIGSTMMACENGSEAEAAYLGALETAFTWMINEEGNLVLGYDSGAGFEEQLTYVPGETPLTGTIWNLVSFGDPEALTDVLTGTAVTAVFAPETDTTGTVGGNATCNNYNSSYVIDGNNISFGPIAGTRMMCGIGADQEAAYMSALDSVQTFEILGSNMQITYDGGVLNYTSLNLPLTNVLWQAIVVAGQPVPEDITITATFVSGDDADAGTVGGSTGCNSYNTGYTTSTDISTNPATHSLTVEPTMAMTMAMCPGEELANLEQSYLATLGAAQSYQILGDQMVVSGEAGDILYAADRQSLLGTTWQLVSLGSIDEPQAPVEGSNFTAQFNRLPSLPTGTVTGETGCNDYNATFAADLTNIKVNLPAKSNNPDCPWGDNYEVEQQYFLALNAATSYRILGNTLQIPYGEGQALNYVAIQPEIDEGEAMDLTPLQGTFWYLSAIGDTQIIPGSEITAGFMINEDGVTGEVSGSGGCNAYNATIGANFVIRPIASTQKACEPAITEQEGGYFDWLSKAYSYDRAGDQLLISTANGVLTYNSTPIVDQANELVNKTWYLVTIEQYNAVTANVPTAFFAPDGSLNGTTGCNDYTSTFETAQDNQLRISELATTRAACTSDAMSTQETVFTQLMPTAVSYVVNGTSMQIQTSGGQPVNFTSIAPVVVGPTAVIISEDLAETGQPMTFDGSQSTAGSAPIVRYDWDLGDGTLLNGTAVQHAYNTAGTYTVKLTVTDQAGQTNSTTKSVQITPVVEVTAPTAVIEGPTSAFVGEQVTFSAAGSQQGTAAITSYQWASGDGNTAGPGPENSFTTIYSAPGVYNVSVTVADAGGLSDTASMQITINANLVGSSWYLANTLPGTSITLDFANGTLSGFAGCNSYNAGYTTTLAAGNTNSISVGPITSTGALCAEDVMAQEQGYLASLQTASVYTITGDSLSLTTANGPLTFYAAVATIQPVPVVTQ